jgi:glycosyltransferase involved in cell wall biosynthesis
MKRVGVDGRELAAGVRTGIGRYILEMLRAASLDGWECVVYGDRTTRLSVALPGVTLRVLNSRWTQWWDQVTLPGQLASDKVSVFLSPYYKGPLRAPCPVVLTIHDLFFIGYPGQRRLLYDAVMTRLARLYAHRAAAIIADSAYTQRSIVDRLGVNKSKVTVIPVALGPEFTPQPFNEAVMRRYGITPPYILYVGNFKPHKNLPRLLRAFSMLPMELQGRHQMVLAGGDRIYRPTIEALAQNLGVAKRVHFPGQIDDSDLPALYSRCTLFILPSLVEGFGLPALEAMACGAPVAAANRAAIPEVVGDAALLFDPEDEAAIATTMARALLSADLREHLVSRGLAQAQGFSSERTSGQVLTLLKEVSGRGTD